MDHQTWPEILQIYLERFKSFDRTVLNALANKDYRLVNIKERLIIMSFLTNQFLLTEHVRGHLMRDQYCRNCQQTGDMMCCETCSATFHLQCIGSSPADINESIKMFQCNSCIEQRGNCFSFDHLYFFDIRIWNLITTKFFSSIKFL